jgi:hypothetical protein
MWPNIDYLVMIIIQAMISQQGKYFKRMTPGRSKDKEWTTYKN